MKEIKIKIPDYLTIDQYRKMTEMGQEDGRIEQLVHIVSSLSDYSKEEIKSWSIKTLTEIATKYSDLVDVKNEFHPIIEWNGQLYGYANINQASLGTYIDIENMSKDLKNNMHQIAATLYRPIKKHRFNSLSFTLKQKIKALNNKVENVFDWYTLQPYDYEARKEVEESFREFPAHIFLGALSFFLVNVNLYLVNTQSSEILTQSQKKKMTNQIMETLSLAIGGGSGLSTTSPSLTYLAYQGTKQ